MEYEGAAVVSRDLHHYSNAVVTCGGEQVRDGQLMIQHNHEEDIARYITWRLVA